jgi:diguanylate cyclase (GGDEF)-like protein
VSSGGLESLRFGKEYLVPAAQFEGRRQVKTAKRAKAVKDELKTYVLLSRLPLPKSYSGRILPTAFLGTSFPLLALVFYLILRSITGLGATLPVWPIVLLATLIGAAVTVYILYVLLAPVSLASRALRDYLEHGTVPGLPTDFTDDAGQLMSDVQRAVERTNQIFSKLKELEELSTKDRLTGAHNRTGFDQRIAEDAARVERSGNTMMLAVLDVDWFKSINDQYGHSAGDACLKHVADVIQRNIRETDWVARWGGDEFALVLWDVEDSSAAHKTLQRITKDLSEHPVRLPQGNEMRLTVSVGACSYESGEDVRKLFVDADRALYQAKCEGRGRIVYAI